MPGQGTPILAGNRVRDLESRRKRGASRESIGTRVIVGAINIRLPTLTTEKNEQPPRCRRNDFKEEGQGCDWIFAGKPHVIRIIPDRLGDFRHLVEYTIPLGLCAQVLKEEKKKVFVGVADFTVPGFTGKLLYGGGEAPRSGGEAVGGCVVGGNRKPAQGRIRGNPCDSERDVGRRFNTAELSLAERVLREAHQKIRKTDMRRNEILGTKKKKKGRA